MTKLAFFNVDENEQFILSKVFEREKTFELSFRQKPIDIHTATIAKDADGIGIFIQSHITQKVLDLLPQLRIIATMSTGFDHIDLEACKSRNITVCNLEACKSRNITVCNVPAYGDNTVAEYTFGLIIALARKLKPTFERVERGLFSRAGLMGMDLKGKTLGLVGAGRIGFHVARLGWAFGMKVIACDVKPNVTLAEKFDVTFLSLEELLQ
ncbi:MAG: hydroxyacid dehydrogenase, partial [Deltaproteobacteria bacterium]|nr:hydroxyacid dehydrogenase [Deltaproteobacteria bacterium]